MRMLLLLVLGLLLGVQVFAALPQPTAEEIAKITAAAPAKATATPEKPRKVLVFTLCKGFPHDSIPYASAAIEIMGQKTGAYTAVISDDIQMFAPDTLAQFDAVILNNTTGELFGPENKDLQENFLKYVRSGHGLVGVHAATDCCYQWGAFGSMIGGYFDGHPWNEKVRVKVEDKEHPLTAAFKGQDFDIADEIYQLKHPYHRQWNRILLRLDVEQGTDMTKKNIKRTDDDFAVSWVKMEQAGRVFYCSLGHRHEIFWTPAILQHYLDGIQWAMGDLKADATPSGKLTMGPEDPFIGEYGGNIYDEKSKKDLLGNRKETKNIWRGWVYTTGGKNYDIRIGRFSGTMDKEVLKGKRVGDKIEFAGKVDDVREWKGFIADKKLLARSPDGKATLEMNFIERNSTTEGQQPPAGAIVLLPYTPGQPTNLSEWQNQGWKILPNGAVQVNGSNNSKRKFGSCQLHAEFLLPHVPYGSGQNRANSGIFIHQYEIQVLDSFGLIPEKGDCGALYNTAAPTVNASRPPLRWQTYDITYTAPVMGNDGKPTQPAKVTVLLNGIKVLDNVAAPKPTATDKFDPSPVGPIQLQDHNWPVRYRNIWVVETK